MHLTGPYLTGPGGAATMAQVATPEEARRIVNYWADEGVTWFKAYTDISRDALGAAIEAGPQARAQVHRASLLGVVPRGGRTSNAIEMYATMFSPDPSAISLIVLNTNWFSSGDWFWFRRRKVSEMEQG